MSENPPINGISGLGPVFPTTSNNPGENKDLQIFESTLVRSLRAASSSALIREYELTDMKNQVF
jgi:hypothetical protein